MSLIDFNELEYLAKQALETGNVERAAQIYAFMADGDTSLDGGYLGEQLGKCFELMKMSYVARFWFRRAIEENPEVSTYACTALARLDALPITNLVEDLRPVMPRDGN